MDSRRVRWALTALLSAVAVAALWLGYRQWQVDRAAAGEPVALGLGVAGATATPEVVVHVAGAVANPGLHRLPHGARVQDAVAAAGPTADAAVEALNLAERLADGDKVFVPTRADLQGTGGLPPAAIGADHSPLPAAQGTGSAGRSGSAAPTAGQAQPRVDLNRATVEELERVPGISREMAERIVRQRQAVGRFRRPEDLLQVPGMSPALLGRIRPYLTV